MNKIPINICLFTTTKGHFGNKDVYQTTVSQLDKQIKLAQFASQVAHIKVTPGDDIVPMGNWLSDRGFNIIYTEGKWSHSDISHQQGYLSDIRSLFNYQPLHKTPYSLWLEDDWVFEPDKLSLLESLEKASYILDSDRNVQGVRFLRKEDDIAARIPTKPYGDIALSNRSEFSFNPTLVRTRDAYTIMTQVHHRYKDLSAHCEMAYTQIAATMTESDAPFVTFNRDQITVRHIGTSDYPQLRDDLTKLLIAT